MLLPVVGENRSTYSDQHKGHCGREPRAIPELAGTLGRMDAGAGHLLLLPPLTLQCHAVPPEPADETGAALGVFPCIHVNTQRI
jgi:hypothetical protein